MSRRREHPGLFAETKDSTESEALKRYVASWVDNIEEAIASNQIKKLTGGASGTGIYQFKWGEKSYILRKHSLEEPEDTFTRKAKLTQIGGNNGLGPTLHCYNTSKKYMVIDFVEGDNLKIDDYDDKTQMDTLIHLIRKMHSITNTTEAALPYTSYFERIRSRLSNARTIISASAYDRIVSLTTRIETATADETSPSGLCHHDIHIGNLIRTTTDTIELIDWDDAGFGPTLCDFALFTATFFEDDDQALLALDTYLQKSADAKTQHHFMLYRYLGYMLRAAFSFEKAALCPEESKEGEVTTTPFKSHYESVKAVLSNELPLSTRTHCETFANACLTSFLAVEAHLDATPDVEAHTAISPR